MGPGIGAACAGAGHGGGGFLAEVSALLLVSMRATLMAPHKARNAGSWRLWGSPGSWLIWCVSGRLGAVPDTRFSHSEAFRESKATSWLGAGGRRRRMRRHSHADAPRQSVIRRRAHARLRHGVKHSANRHHPAARRAYARFRNVRHGNRLRTCAQSGACFHSRSRLDSTRSTPLVRAAGGASHTAPLRCRIDSRRSTASRARCGSRRCFAATRAASA